MNNARRRLYSNTQTKLEWEEAWQQITRFFIILLSFFLAGLLHTETRWFDAGRERRAQGVVNCPT